ncbi:MAG: hypothetical protein K6B65_04670 [Bacilli bacterium]|nr:hypothetical protein [Bacilli bacterium]
MATIEAVKRCFSCGAMLQCEDPNAEGYINPEIFNNFGPESLLLCEHCYSEARYNQTPRASSVSEDMLAMVRDAKAKDGLIVYVVDLFSFEASFPPELVELLTGMRMIVLANKLDLLPEKIDKETLREYVAHRFRVAKLSVTHNDVYLVHLDAQADVAEIAEEVQSRRQGKDVFLIGSSRAGKTAFRDAFLRCFSNISHHPIVTSNYGETDLPVMHIPLDDHSTLYDSPGIELNNDVRGVVAPSLRRKIVPNKAVKARKIIMTKGMVVAIEGIAAFYLKEGKRTPIYLYCKEELHVSTFSYKHLDDNFFGKIKGKKLKVYDPNHIDSNDFDAFELTVTENGERDIGIEGLGWFSFEAGSQVFALLVPKCVSIYTSRAKIGKKHGK